MDFTPHELHRGLVMGIPMLIMLLLAIWRRWLHTKNREISAELQRRSE